MQSTACVYPAHPFHAVAWICGSHREVQHSNRQPQLRFLHAKSTGDTGASGWLTQFHRMRPWCALNNTPLSHPYIAASSYSIALVPLISSVPPW